MAEVGVSYVLSRRLMRAGLFGLCGLADFSELELDDVSNYTRSCFEESELCGFLAEV